jgi:hypothetical protein
MRRTIVTLGLAVAFGLAAGQTVVVNKETVPGKSSPYDYSYNTASQVSVTGKIVGIGSSKPNHEMPTNTRLIVQTLGKHPSTYLVELGPQWFLSDQPTHPKLGQWVKVTGSKITDHGQTKILAMNVQLHNHDVLALRRANGDPYWVDLSVPAETVTAQSSTPAVGTILSTTTFTIGGVQYPGYVVQTSSGPQNIVMMSDIGQTYMSPPVQSYSLGNDGNIHVIGAGYYPVLVTGGPFGASPYAFAGYPGFPGYTGVLTIGPHW